jgi:hypothetical protein
VDYLLQCCQQVEPLIINKQNYPSYKILIISTRYYITSPVIFSKTIGFDAFDFIVTVFVCIPSYPEELKTTSIIPLFPGGTGFLSYLETVQPQLVVAEDITSGPVPVFSKVKIYATFSPAVILPKLCSYSLKLILAVSDMDP